MAPLTDEEAQERLESMVAIIDNEADLKVASLRRREGDLARQKALYVRRGIDAISAHYARLETRAHNDTKVCLLRMRNNVRLKVLSSKDAMVEKVFEAVRQRLGNLPWDNGNLHRKVFAGLILQGLLKIMEPNVLVVVRPSDLKVASLLMPTVMENYQSTLSERIPKEVCSSYKARLAEPLETVHVIMESDLGGVLLVAESGKIVVDNTLRKRFQLLQYDLLPQLKHMLFRSVLRTSVMPTFDPKYMQSKMDVRKQAGSKNAFRLSYVSYPPNGSAEFKN